MVSLKFKDNQYKHKSSFLQKNIAAFRFPIFRLLCIRWLVHIHNVIRIKNNIDIRFLWTLMNISRPNMKYQLIAKDIHNDDKVRMHQGWGGLFWPKTLGYIWSIFIKHIYSTEWLTLVDIPEKLSNGVWHDYITQPYDAENWPSMLGGTC